MTKSFTKNLFAGAALCALISAAARAQDSDEDASAPSNNQSKDTIIVTGVFKEASLETAPVAVTALSEDEITRAAASSAADLLKSVPGVFVNSAFGEIRNIVYSRGVSAGSNEAASGYFYVSLQEDGLPVSNVTFNNYGPDFFARPDIMLKRVEALRGGTATITGPNAPGGIFNYIQKNGRDDPGGRAAFKAGLEGDSDNPYYRGDFYYGGQAPGADNLYYSIGGFYRHSEGARPSGTPLNKGGQIRGNLLWEYDKGEVTLGAKYLNDHNGFFEFLTAKNFDNPGFISGIKPTDSFTPPSNPHSWVDAAGQQASWDGSQRAHTKQIAVSLDWTHELGDGWEINNKARFADNTVDWNTGALIFPLPITDNFVYILTNTFGQAGTFRFRDPNGQILAVVDSPSGFARTVTSSNLPNSAEIGNAVLTQVAFDPLHEVKEFTDQITISKLWGPHAFTTGAFYTHADIHREQSGGGLGISPVMNRPYLFDIELERPGGELVQITSPEGFAAIGDTSGGGTSNDGDKDQFSIFFGHAWEINDRLSLDWGLRYENIHYKVTNQTVAAPANFGDPTEGGADGDPLTYWDNFPNVLATVFDTERNYDYFSYSASLGYELTDGLQTYVRFSSGKKAPDFQTLLDIDSQAEVDNLFVEPQKIQQVEVGVKYSSDNIRLAVFPFWSELSNVASNQLFTDQNGQIYSPTPTTATLTTFGVEIEADYQITEALNLSTALTIQNSESKDFAIWVANTPSRDDDVLVATPDGDADNIPHVMARTTLSYAPTDWASAFVTWNYLGDRPANRYNTFDLPAFSIFDLGVYFQLTDSLQLRADVKNVLNETEGVLSWAPSGGFFAALDRQAFTPAQLAANPDQFFSIVTAPPRAYFLTLDLTF